MRTWFHVLGKNDRPHPQAQGRELARANDPGLISTPGAGVVSTETGRPRARRILGRRGS
jgi:hypothetical protein